MDIFSVSPNIYKSVGTLNILILLTYIDYISNTDVNHKNLGLLQGQRQKMFVQKEIVHTITQS